MLKEKGITQVWVAKKTFVSTQAVYNYVHGKRLPSLDLALRIARTLNMTVEELFGDRV